MAKLNVFLADETYYERMMALDHHVASRQAFKLEIRSEEGNSQFSFQRIRLPREINLSYPRELEDLQSHWEQADHCFVGMVEDHLLAYMVLDVQSFPKTVRITDLVVENMARRKGIASSMLAVSETWALSNQFNRVLLDIPLRNDPMVRLAQKMGYNMCGFLDQYFPNNDPAVFFEKRIG